MEEKYVLNLKDADFEIFEVCVYDKYHCVGRVSISQVKEAAQFVREKWGTEPLFYYECHYGWLKDKEDNRYEFVKEKEATDI